MSQFSHKEPLVESDMTVPWPFIKTANLLFKVTNAI